MKLRNLLGAFIFFTTAAAVAAPKYAGLSVDGVEIGPLISFLEQEVVVLDASTTVYNWSPNAKIYENGYKTWAQNAATTFWKAYGSPTYSMYGSGLYAAMDPAITYTFGGTKETWLLTEIKLPKGFRMIDVNSPKKAAMMDVPENVQAIAAKFGCAEYSSSLSADRLFVAGGYGASKSCQEIVKKIYKDILHIEGFTYTYGRMSMKECDAGYNLVNQSALVLTDANWMTPDAIKYYTAKSTGDVADRTRIQTLFLKTVNLSEMGGLQSIDQNKVQSLIAEFLDSHSELSLKDSSSQCNVTSCTITVRFCDAADACQMMQLPPMLRRTGDLITADNAAKTVYGAIMWPDLEGKKQTAEIGKWIKENLYGCSGKEAYRKP